MDDNRRKILKKIFYSGVSMTLPISFITLLTRDEGLLAQKSSQINNVGDDMYEIDGWIVTSSDLYEV